MISHANINSTKYLIFIISTRTFPFQFKSSNIITSEVNSVDELLELDEILGFPGGGGGAIPFNLDILAQIYGNKLLKFKL